VQNITLPECGNEREYKAMKSWKRLPRGEKG
jgi:hypothetical protein